MLEKSSFCTYYIQQLFYRNPYSTVRLTVSTTRVHPDESQEVLVVASYNRILPLALGPFATKNLTFLLQFRI